MTALLQSYIFSTLSTDDKNVTDGKENERETNRKKIYRVLKKGIYGFARINDPVYGCKKDRVVTDEDEENPKILPQRGEIDKIVSFFYHTYKVKVHKRYNLESRGSTLA